MARERMVCAPIIGWVIIDHGTIRHLFRRSRYGAYPMSEIDTPASLEREHGGTVVQQFGDKAAALRALQDLWAVEEVVDEVPNADDIDKFALIHAETRRKDRARMAADMVKQNLGGYRRRDGRLEPAVVMALQEMFFQTYDLELKDPHQVMPSDVSPAGSGGLPSPPDFSDL